MIPTYAVIPVRDQLALTRSIVAQLRAQQECDGIVVVDHGSGPATAVWLRAEHAAGRLVHEEAAGQPFYRLWNRGVERVRRWQPQCNVAILNNDVRLGPRCLAGLAAALQSDPDLWAVCPRYDGRDVGGVHYVQSTFKRNGFAGFAFMVKGEAFDEVHFDESYEWWYGDDDFVAQVVASGHRVAIVGDVSVDHLGGGSQTARHHLETLLPAIMRDWHRMVVKWGHD